MTQSGMSLIAEVQIGSPSLGGPVENVDNTPPAELANEFREGFKKHGPAGQLWIVREGKWEKF